MERLTTNKDISDMEMYELAHNSCYLQNGFARYRDFEDDVDARELTRKLLMKYAENYIACKDDDNFDKEMLELLQYGTTTIEGLIALFYRNLWAMANLRERLKIYEDAEEQGLLLKLPFKEGDRVYEISDGLVEPCTVEVIFVADYKDDNGEYCNMAEIHYDREDCPWVSTEIYFTDIGKNVFLTQEAAEQALAEMKGV